MPDNLRELMNRGPLDPSTALQIQRQVLQALAFAHWRETDCGPITPDTVLFSERGTAQLVGCGLRIAEFDDDEGAERAPAPDAAPPSLRVDESAVDAAAPFYLAPEQIAGEGPDERSDMFVLGMLLYEMLTGRHPFGASDGLSAAVVQERILSEPPQELPPATLTALPPHLPALLARALAKDRDERFPDAVSFMDALDGPTVGMAPVEAGGEVGAEAGPDAGPEALEAVAEVVESAPEGLERVVEAGGPAGEGVEPAAEALESADASNEPPEPLKSGGRRWLLYGVVGIIAIALVAALTFVALDSRSDPGTAGIGAAATSTVPPTSAAPTTATPGSTTTTEPPSATTTSVTPTTTTTLVRTHYEEDDPLLLYAGTWTRSEDQAASGGSFVFADSDGASVTIAFEGTHLAWIAKRSPVYGMADVTLDGQRLGTIDLYSAETVFQQKVWGSGQLEPGLHTVTIAWTGEKNPVSTGTNINVDEVNVMGALVETESHE